MPRVRRLADDVDLSGAYGDLAVADDPRRIVYTPLSQIAKARRNPKRHAIGHLAGSINRFGFASPLILDERTGRLVAGHGRTETLSGLKEAALDPPEGIRVDPDGEWLVPVLRGWRSNSDAEAEAFLVADNRQAEIGGWDDDLLAQMLSELGDYDGLGYEPGEIEALLGKLGGGQDGGSSADDAGSQSLTDRFIVPPFSILDTRQGYWKDRKNAWLALGLASAEGRAEGLAFSGGLGVRYGHGITHDTSVFDPVLCELLVRWFSPSDGRVLDPFAGGSVRGVVSALLGRRYVGIDVRSEQVEENRSQWGRISTSGPSLAADAPAIPDSTPELTAVEQHGDIWIKPDDLFWVGGIRPSAVKSAGSANRPEPQWIIGDSRDLPAILAGEDPFDLVLSCPPYADLERYSDDPADLSTLDYDLFLPAYRQIIADAVSRLADNRFAAWVVGDIRDARGLYRGFVGDTIQAFEASGARLYNDAVLANAIATAAIRAGRQFSAGRKMVKVHQNVLIFVKGDPKIATAACGQVEVHLPEAAEEEAEATA